MIDLKKIQKDVFQNKTEKGFNTTDVNREFCFAYGELSEAYDAYRKKKDDLGEELADVAICLLGLSEMLGLDLEEEIAKKVAKNEKRKYENVDGVNIRIEE
ncbi:MAG: MazG-like family protein [Candidatus Pacebacteria bacterium]|nr:MazG-like family protein [Candidatus Paceibacterota bacterium]